MISPLDPFAARFDSIEVDRTLSSAAFDQALAALAPAREPPSDPAEPGFYLLDDCGGRFVVDRELGVVSLRDARVLDKESGAVHTARLKVIEPSGVAYEMDLRLRLTGLVPQLADGDEFAALASIGATSVTTPPAPTITLTTATSAQSPPIAWTAFFAAGGIIGPVERFAEDAAYGALVDVNVPRVAVSTSALALDDALPAPSARGVAWLI